jgi:integrase
MTERRLREDDRLNAMPTPIHCETMRSAPCTSSADSDRARGPFTADAINRLIKRIGVPAGRAVHAQMLRHACEYALDNAGHDTRRIQDWLGHRSIAHTTRYTPRRSRSFGVGGP